MAGALFSATAVAQIPDPVRTALRAGDAVALAAAFEAGADPEAREAEGYGANALMYAASNPDPALVNAVLAAGAEINARDRMGDPALNWASYYGHTDVIVRLLEAGADPGLRGHGNAREILMRRGHQTALAAFLAALGAGPERTGAEITLETAALEGDIATIQSLAGEADVSTARDFAGRPVLQAAARAGQGEAILALIAAGAPVDGLDSIGFTALFEAAREGHDAAVSALLDQGADINHIAEPHGLSLTPLHLAAIGGNAAVVQTLMQAGARPDVQGVTGATPMLWAAFEGQHDAVKALLQGGADASIQAPDSPSVRDVAVMSEWSDIVAMIDGEGGE
ncbi:ankyrin repeat domain-containing protein [Maricaulis sp.]|uniref:ankyrin repeat domain-containing protein n=1 Tax=Maricaulis sp. TaxID=1486257 RepID=UPI003A903110